MSTDLPVHEISWVPDELITVAGDEDPLVDALLDSESYRTSFQAALHELHRLTQELNRLRESHHRLLDQYRHLCEQTMRVGMT